MIFGDKIMTPRLTLRRTVKDDLQQLVAWSNCQRAHGNYLTPEGLDTAQGLENILSGAYWNEANRLFIIQIKDDKPIGTLHYWLRAERKTCAVMALKISDPELRNLGYGTEAQKYVIIWLLQRMKLQCVEMYTDINNKSQQRCLAKLGFELVETLSYDDRQVKRVGYLFRLGIETFSKTSIYQYCYE